MLSQCLVIARPESVTDVRVCHCHSTCPETTGRCHLDEMLCGIGQNNVEELLLSQHGATHYWIQVLPSFKHLIWRMLLRSAWQTQE